jgi:tRNA U34 5-methylaminomethyl-2-thiouridine-forming methyltransferase MnmC
MSNKKDDIKLVLTQDGSHSLFSEQFGEQYHSKYGAIRESQHVFIESGLFYKLASGDKLNILEIGLGSGLNAFLTYLETVRRTKSIYYEALEAYPLPLAEAKKLNYPEQLHAKDHEKVFIQMHELPWNEAAELSENFTFKKTLRRFEEIDGETLFDIIYFDAFAPGTQPELWENPVLSRICDRLSPGGVFVTYSAKGSVKRNLKALGLIVENLPGPPGKREMIRAIKQTADS